MQRTEHQKQYAIKNKEKIALKNKEYREKNRDAIRSRDRDYDKNHRDLRRLSKRNSRLKHKTKRLKENREYYILNRERLKDYQRQYRKLHPHAKNIYHKKRCKLDLGYKILCNLRKRVNTFLNLKKIKKCNTTSILLGCDLITLKEHLESQFKEGMSWDTYGRFGWHVDHKRPCASYDLRDPKQQEECFHYTNLQPLWWDENIKKGAKYG